MSNLPLFNHNFILTQNRQTIYIGAVHPPLTMERADSGFNIQPLHLSTLYEASRLIVEKGANFLGPVLGLLLAQNIGVVLSKLLSGPWLETQQTQEHRCESADILPAASAFIDHHLSNST